MRKLIFAAAVAAFASATPAFAADTGSTVINASLAPSCSIITQSGTLTLGAVDAPVSGVFTYKCNFIGQPGLTFTSANQGVMTSSNGGSTKHYGIYLNDAAPSGSVALPSQWLQSSATPQGYTNISTSNPANAPISPYFQVGLTEALDVAGSYTDTLTININP